MPRPTHFEIHASDPDAVSAFYAAVFGWTFHKWDGPSEYWIVDTGKGKGIHGGMLRRKGAASEGAPVNAFVCTVGVPSADEYVRRVTANGGTIAAPKTAVKGMGWLAYCKDPDGNIFGMMEEDEKAA